MCALSRRNLGWSRCGFFVVTAAIASTSAAEAPAPTRKPRPRTLAEYAQRVQLEAPHGYGNRGCIVINTALLAEIARHGTLIPGSVEISTDTPRSEASAEDRARWRKRYFDQRRAVEKLEQRRARVASDLDRLESGRLTAAVMARIDRTEAELETLDAEIRTARAELGRIVRDARRHGAEPGWFR